MKSEYVFTSESVTDGHPDKLCDQICDAIVDQHLTGDPFSRVIAECAVSNGIVFIAARMASRTAVDLPSIARQEIARVGYLDGPFGARTCSILTNLSEMPPAPTAPVDERDLDDAGIERIAATNHATVFGFACRQSPALMPLPIWLAHKLARRLSAARQLKQMDYLAPDGKTQVAITYRNRRPARLHSLSIIAALGTGAAPDDRKLKTDLMEAVILPAFRDEELQPDEHTQIFINPGGPFMTGGPAVHSGMTGRKVGIDTYGEYSRQGAAALSGKDPGRIDRIGVYAARYAAKNVVAAGLAEACEIQLSYTIGQARPVGVQVETFGTGKIGDEELHGRVLRAFDFRPAAIIAQFNLRHAPSVSRGRFYSRLAAYGHVGRMDVGLAWEKIDRVDALRG